jgi:hypothetical protein
MTVILRWSDEQLAAYLALRTAVANDAPIVPPARAKYGNKKVSIDGKKFDSKAEGARYVELKRLQEGGVISGLKTQEEFALPVNGVLVCKYLADFCYVDSDGNRVVEDVKGGPVTQVYTIKNKLMKAIHGIEIKEVRKVRRSR